MLKENAFPSTIVAPTLLCSKHGKLTQSIVVFASSMVGHSSEEQFQSRNVLRAADSSIMQFISISSCRCSSYAVHMSYSWDSWHRIDQIDCQKWISVTSETPVTREGGTVASRCLGNSFFYPNKMPAVGSNRTSWIKAVAGFSLSHFSPSPESFDSPEKSWFLEYLRLDFWLCSACMLKLNHIRCRGNHCTSSN